MPKRDDIQKILLIGSGPIVIGQACEFDYSGTQACKALREEGYTIILLNSNPATIMTDPDFADRTYIEPITNDVLCRIIEQERPDALLPTLGGQTALNSAVAVAEAGVLERYGVEMIGASVESILKAEDRDLFRQSMRRIGLQIPASGCARTGDEARAIRQEIGLPAIIRPSFTLGGTGGNIARTEEEFDAYVHWGISASPRGEILVESSVLGWKEYELEVMRDGKDNVVIICSIENFDAMGVHTGDSITVAPAQTLTDKEYQVMRDAAIAIIREIGVDTGGSNIQFAVDPRTGEMVVIEMNPRVSRSSALASKATGFPIAKIAAKLAIGYLLEEIPNDITRVTPASFEPTMDYVVTKVPRFTFEKFPQTSSELTTQMKSVGEVMAIGRTFKESLQKAIRSLEIDRYGFEPVDEAVRRPPDRGTARQRLQSPTAERLWHLADAFRAGLSREEIADLTAVDPWFLSNLEEIIEEERKLQEAGPELFLGSEERARQAQALLRRAKEHGFSDRRIAELCASSEERIRHLRHRWRIRPVFKHVDTCAAEFEAHTPYLYSTYDLEDESAPTSRRKIMILGGGPNRIGQGIEFDYCCVHAAFALKELGIETIMVNCNPETVSTDYDTSDRLYFEPLTIEDVLEIYEKEKPDGVIIQFGGQTPLKLAVPLAREGVPILGTSPDSIDRAEDRERFQALLRKLGLRQPENGIARSAEEAARVAEAFGFPVVVRPSYVLGGRAMQIVYDRESLAGYMAEAVRVSPHHPILVDKFLPDAIEVDVDAVGDGECVVIGGVMEHIEEAGVHSGDSACSLPPYSLKREVVAEIEQQTRALALDLGVIGLMNVQFAVKGEEIFILEVNPRASRTVPFVSKAIGKPLAKIATKVMAGESLASLSFTEAVRPRHIAVKEAVFPFVKFPGVDTILGPEMKSTGEVMGIDKQFGRAFAKAQIGAGVNLPVSGPVLISVKDADKAPIVALARTLVERGFCLIATTGTTEALRRHGLPVERVNKVLEGSPHTVEAIEGGRVAMVINTVHGASSIRDSFSMRRSALVCSVPYFTTVAGARAAVEGIVSLLDETLGVRPLQEYY